LNTEHKFRKYEDEVLGKRKEGSNKKMYEALDEIYSSPSTVKVIKSIRIWQALSKRKMRARFWWENMRKETT
jgi:hypothetical protein